MRMILNLICCFLMAGSLLAAEARFVTVRGKEIVGPDGKPLLLRGIGLGNWLVQEGYMFKLEGGLHQSPREIHELVAQLVGPTEARSFWLKFYDNYITRDDIELIKRAGFNSIRVPFNYRLLTPEESPGVWLAPGFELLDRVVRWSHDAGIYVILDMHCAPGGQTGANIDDSWGYPWLYESPESQQRAVEVWRKIAERYRDEPAVLAYDLLNEPLPHFPEFRKYDPMLEPLYRRVVAAIREVDRNHIVILEGPKWDTTLENFGPPFDSKAVYSFHKYWSPTTQETIQEFLDFRNKYNVPIWLGETGENNDEWISAMVELAERNNIGWAFWPYKKMDATSSAASFERPKYWDEILQYARICGGVETKEKREARLKLSIEHCRASLAELLNKIQFPLCRINENYLRALHLKPGTTIEH